MQQLIITQTHTLHMNAQLLVDTNSNASIIHNPDVTDIHATTDAVSMMIQHTIEQHKRSKNKIFSLSTIDTSRK